MQTPNFFQNAPKEDSGAWHMVRYVSRKGTPPEAEPGRHVNSLAYPTL